MKTGRVCSIAAVLAVLALGGCDNPSGGGSPPPGGNNDPPAAYTVGGTISLSGGSGTVSAVSVALKQGGASRGATNPGAGGVYSFSGVAAGNYTIEASLSGYVTMTIPEFAVSADTDKSFSLTADDLPPPGDLNGNLWTGNAATLSTAGQAVTITVTWDAAGAAGSLGMPQAFKDRIDASHTVTVIFTKGASDRIRFDRITELRQALTGEGVSAGVITMKSSAVAGEEVSPLFNGDDLYGWPGDAATMTGKVFSLYTTDNEKIFGNITVRNTSGAGWYIDVPAGQKIVVEKLRMIDYNSAAYLDGFGLKAARADITFDTNPVLSGARYNGSAYGALLLPAKLDRGFQLMGLDTTADFPVFTLGDIALRNAAGTPVNLADSPRVMAFLEKYMTAGDISKLEGLTVVSSNIILQKAAVPYSGNGYSGVGESDKVNGNLAVWLGSKGVALREVYLTNPSLYALPTNITGVRNVVFDGNNWKNITVAGANGVVVSVNTPVSQIGSPGNLWYVVQGQSDSGYTTQIITSVLEVGNIGAPNKLVPANYQNPLLALITANGTVRGAINANFTPIGKEYTGASSTTWQAWAQAVKDNTPLPVFQ